MYGVTLGELGPAVPNAIPNPYSGQQWDQEVIRAQSVAARTWGTFWCRKRLLGNGQQGVWESTSDQRYRPYYAGLPQSEKNRFVALASDTRGVYLTEEGLLVQSPYNGKRIDAQYRNDVGDPTMTAQEQQIWSSYNYLKSVDSPFSTGVNNGVGWTQIPSQGWRRFGQQWAGYPQLLHQYYTGVYLYNKPEKFTSRYWNKTDANCANLPSSTSTSKDINFDWGAGGPAGVNSDNFCADWQDSSVTFSAQDWYTFYLILDDGARLWIDGDLVMDLWNTQSVKMYTVSVFLGAGVHSIQLRYFENTGTAVARLGWLRGFGMVGKYYNYIIPSSGNVSGRIPNVV